MNEQNELIEALQFYRIVKLALKTPGIERIVLILGDDGEMEAHVAPDLISLPVK